MTRRGVRPLLTSKDEGAARSPDLPAALALGALAGVLLWTRLSGLQAGFWRDEVYTVVHYASQGPSGIWLGHYEPNDHVLFNLLAWVCHGLLGGGEAVYRLPSVIPGILAIVLLAAWLWREGQASLAVIFGVLAVSAPLHLELVKQARGYGLGFLAGALLLIGAVELARSLTPAGREATESPPGTSPALALVCLTGAALLGIWTLTGFAFAVATQLLALAIVLPRRRQLLLVSAVVVIGSLVFYAPLLGQILRPLGGHGHYFAGQVGQPLRWYAFLTGPFDQFAAPYTRDLLHVHGLLLPRLLGLGLTGLGVIRLVRRDQEHLAVLLLVPLILTELSLTVLRVNVAPRFLSFLLLHFLLLCACGILGLLDAARGPQLRRAAIGVALCLGLVTVVRGVQLAAHWNAVPIEAAKRIAALVHGAGFDSVLSDSDRPRALRYYLGEGGVSLLPPAGAQRFLCRQPGPLAFVDHLAFRAEFVDTACLADRGARLLVVPERDGKLPIDVWLLGRPTPLGLDLPSATATVGQVCGKHGLFPRLRAGPLLVSGSLGAAHPEAWRVKIKLKRCVAGRFSQLDAAHDRPGPDGRFRLTLPGVPAGDYELRAEARPTAGGQGAQSPRRWFRVAH